ncbi:MAG: hypothetical protein L7F77_14805 [Candidatus Magnetominusculus sp. LBB02]|nr:hypothetical protein [Candidatus Magnetominusculus sp. LBB02]
MAAVGAVNTNNVINALQSVFGTPPVSSSGWGSATRSSSASSSAAYKLNLSSLAQSLAKGIVSSNLSASPMDSLGQSMSFLNMTSGSNINQSFANSFVNPSTISSMNLTSSQSLTDALSSIGGSLSNANAMQQSGLYNTNPSFANAINVGTNANSKSISTNSLPTSAPAFQSFSKSVVNLLSSPNPIVSLFA